MTVTRHCWHCDDELPAQATGRPRHYCDKPECRRAAAAMRQRKRRFEQKLGRRLVPRRPRTRRSRRQASDKDLETRAAELNARYLQGLARWTSIAFVPVPQQAVADCQPDSGRIRLGKESRDFPDYVLDYLLIHEMAHTLVRGHPPKFWKLVSEYPDWARADGWLDGYYRRKWADATTEAGEAPESGSVAQGSTGT